MGKLIDIIDVSLATILTGDFDCVLDSKLDRFPVGKSKDQGSDELIQLTTSSD